MAVPLRDDVPTRSFPWITVLLIALNVFIFLFVQPSAFQNPPNTDDPPVEVVTRTQEAAVFTFRCGARYLARY